MFGSESCRPGVNTRSREFLAFGVNCCVFLARNCHIRRRPCDAGVPGESNHLREDSNLAATFRDRGQNSLIWKESLYPGVSGHGRETERSRPAGRKVSCITPCSLACSGPTRRSRCDGCATIELWSSSALPTWRRDRLALRRSKQTR